MDELIQIVTLTTGTAEPELNSVTDGNEILKIMETVKQIPVAEPVLKTALKLVMATHPENESSPEITKKYVRFGASPRGAQAIIKTAKIRALLEGRYNVAFEDIYYTAYPSLRHRLLINFDGVAEGISADFIISELIKEVLETI